MVPPPPSAAEQIFKRNRWVQAIGMLMLGRMCNELPFFVLPDYPISVIAGLRLPAGAPGDAIHAERPQMERGSWTL
jgi:hypothetical protein